MHGYSGPLKVSYGGAFTNVGKDFLEVGAKYDPKRGSVDDPNNLFECDKFGVRGSLLCIEVCCTDLMSAEMAEVSSSWRCMRFKALKTCVGGFRPRPAHDPTFHTTSSTTNRIRTSR